MSLQEEYKIMLDYIIKNKRAFSTLFRSNYYTYSKDDLIGYFAIINDKALISYIEDINNTDRAIATANFTDNGLLIFKLLENNFSKYQKGWTNPLRPHQFHVSKSSRLDVIEQINCIKKHCDEAKEKTKKLSIFSKPSKKLSKSQVKLLITDTLDGFCSSKQLDERNSLCSKHTVNSVSLDTSTNNNSVLEQDLEY